MVSQLVRSSIRDRDRRRARLEDLAIDLSAGDYPPVTFAVFAEGGERRTIAWSALRRDGDDFETDDLAEAAETTPDQLADMVLLKRDVMDALILDLVGERAVRANDVWVREENGALIVRGIDVSPWAVIRRLARGWMGLGSDRDLLDARDVIYLRGDPRRAILGHDYHRQILRLSPGQIARLAEALPYVHAAELIWLLPDDVAADVFEFLTPARQVQVLAELARSKAVGVLAGLSPDRAADVLARLDLEEARELLEELPEDRSALVTDLLRYPADTAGGIMTNELVVVPSGLRISEAIDYVRPRLASPDFVYFIYVVDQADAPGRCRLLGVMTLRDLLVADPERLVDDVMNRGMVVAKADEPARLVAYRLADTQLNALPVVDDGGRLLGAITIDNAVAQIAPETVRQDIPTVFA